MLDESSIEYRLVVFTEIGTKKLQFSFVDDSDGDVNTKLSWAFIMGQTLLNYFALITSHNIQKTLLDT